MLVISAVRRSLHGLQRDIMAFTTPLTVYAAGTRFFKGYAPLDWEASPTNSWDEQLSRRYIMYSALHFHPIRCLNSLQTLLLPNSFQPIFSLTPLVPPPCRFAHVFAPHPQTIFSHPSYWSIPFRNSLVLLSIYLRCGSPSPQDKPT